MVRETRPSRSSPRKVTVSIRPVIPSIPRRSSLNRMLPWPSRPITKTDHLSPTRFRTSRAWHPDSSGCRVPVSADAGKDPCNDAGDDPGDDGDDPGDDPGKDAGDDPGKDAGDHPGNDAGDHPGNDAGDHPGNDAGNDQGAVTPATRRDASAAARIAPSVPVTSM